MSDEELSLYPWRKKVKTLPASIKNPVVNMIRVGHIPKLSVMREKVRDSLGLNQKPPTAYQFKTAQAELEELVLQTNLYRKATWNPKAED
jgi:hypothetical protein